MRLKTLKQTSFQEIFGPLLTAYVYKDNEALEVVKKLKDSTAFGLTGAVFSEDR